MTQGQRQLQPSVDTFAASADSLGDPATDPLVQLVKDSWGHTQVVEEASFIVYSHQTQKLVPMAHGSIYEQEWDIVRFLLEKGVDVNVTDKEGNNALGVCTKYYEDVPEDVYRSLVTSYTLDKAISRKNQRNSLEEACSDEHKYRLAHIILEYKSNLDIVEEDWLRVLEKFCLPSSDSSDSLDSSDSSDSLDSSDFDFNLLIKIIPKQHQPMTFFRVSWTIISFCH